jgi:hypothetical protein
MSRIVVFSAKPSENHPESARVTFKVKVPTFADATEQQKKVAFELFAQSQSPIVKAQGKMRDLMKAGLKEDELHKEAQQVFNAIVDGRAYRHQAHAPVITKEEQQEQGFSKKQLEWLAKNKGAIVES